MGFRYHQLRLVDRHRSRRNTYLCDPSSAQSKVAYIDQPLRRSDDTFRRGLRRDVPAAAHRTSVAGRVLAIPLSEHDGHLAAVSQPAYLGRVRCIDLRNYLAIVLVRRADPRSRYTPRPCEE